MDLIANILIVIGSLILLFSSINFAKTRDIFCAAHFVMIANIFGLSLLIIGLGFEKFNLIAIIKILILILLNIIITILITQSITRRALINHTTPRAEIERLNNLKEEQDGE